MIHRYKEWQLLMNLRLQQMVEKPFHLLLLNIRWHQLLYKNKHPLIQVEQLLIQELDHSLMLQVLIATQ